MKLEALLTKIVGCINWATDRVPLFVIARLYCWHMQMSMPRTLLGIHRFILQFLKGTWVLSRYG